MESGTQLPYPYGLFVRMGELDLGSTFFRLTAKRKFSGMTLREKKMIKIGILGYYGRMGQAVAAEVTANPACTLAGGVVLEADLAKPKPAGVLLSAKADDIMAASDVMIDFTLQPANAGNVKAAVAAKKAYVCCTTGLTEADMRNLEQASRTIPLLLASNTSLSLAAMKRVTALAAKLLADFEYDVAILDEHHSKKIDAPSGTAKTLGETVTASNSGKKNPTYAAIRAGHIVGNHEVIFTGNGETIRLRHEVTDRAIFARGAVQAALWLSKKPAGFYSMDDVLGI